MRVEKGGLRKRFDEEKREEISFEVNKRHRHSFGNTRASCLAYSHRRPESRDPEDD